MGDEYFGLLIEKPCYAMHKALVGELLSHQSNHLKAPETC
jgi:hypothetical protein